MFFDIHFKSKVNHSKTIIFSSKDIPIHALFSTKKSAKSLNLCNYSHCEKINIFEYLIFLNYILTRAKTFLKFSLEFILLKRISVNSWIRRESWKRMQAMHKRSHDCNQLSKWILIFAVSTLKPKQTLLQFQ